MEYHRLKPRFNTAAYDPKRISFVYVLSQNEGKGPYKVGMSKGDLWRRMSNYATAFVDFYVYYLVPVPYADVFAVERFMHRAALVLSLCLLSSRPPAPGTSLSKLSGADAIRLQIGHASAG